jgi:hypothetical protein
MNHLNQRLNRLEKATGRRNRACICFRNFQGISPRTVVYYPEDGDEKPSTICEDYGGQIRLICVVYEKPEFPNHQVGSESLP